MYEELHCPFSKTAPWEKSFSPPLKLFELSKVFQIIDEQLQRQFY